MMTLHITIAEEAQKAASTAFWSMFIPTISVNKLYSYTFKL